MKLFMKALALLCAVLIASTAAALCERNDDMNDSTDQARLLSDAAEKVRQSGIRLEDDLLRKMIANDDFIPNPDAYASMSGVILEALALGHYDYDTDVWTPYSDQVYAFDMEFFNIEHMYELFLQGVQAIVPDVTITDVQEDLSGLNDDLDGSRIVSFLCNGHPYSFELEGMHDWIDLNMPNHMRDVLRAEGCPHDLHIIDPGDQILVLYYGEQENADAIDGLLSE